METLPVRYNSTRTTMSACCPFCIDAGKTKDTKYHLYIVPGKFVFCFRCDYKISYSRFIERFRIDSSGLKTSATVEAPVKPPDTFQNLLKKYTQDYNDGIYSEAALNYLHKRKVTDKLIKDLNIKLGVDKLFGRVVFIDELNNYFLARSFLPFVEPKTLNPVGSASLRPFMYFKKKDYNALYLVEGCFDAIPFFKTGRDVAVLLGKDVSQYQLKQLASVKVDNLIISLDVDAFDSAKKLVAQIAAKLPLTTIGILMYDDRSGKDPSDYDVSLFEKISIHWVRIMGDITNGI